MHVLLSMHKEIVLQREDVSSEALVSFYAERYSSAERTWSSLHIEKIIGSESLKMELLQELLHE